MLNIWKDIYTGSKIILVTNLTLLQKYFMLYSLLDRMCGMVAEGKIGFSIARNHIAVAPEAVVIQQFEKEIEEAGYSNTKELFRIKWTDKVDYELLRKIVAYNIEDKKDLVKFWR